MGRNGAVSDLERHVDVIVALQDVNRTTTELVAQLRGLTVNNVLFSGVAVLDAYGVWSRDWSVPFAAVSVGNHGTGVLTVTGDPPQATRPYGGEGVQLIGPGDPSVVNLASRTLTIYGNPGDRLSVEVFDKPQGPSPSGGGPGGGPIATAVTGGGPVAVGDSIAAVPLMAANPARKGGLIFNNSSATLHVGFGAVAPTLALFSFKVGPQQMGQLDSPVFTGLIQGIWDVDAGGAAMVTELT